MLSVDSDKDTLTFIEAEFTLSPVIFFFNTPGSPSARHYPRIDIFTFKIC